MGKIMLKVEISLILKETKSLFMLVTAKPVYLQTASKPMEIIKANIKIHLALLFAFFLIIFFSETSVHSASLISDFL